MSNLLPRCRVIKAVYVIPIAAVALHSAIYFTATARIKTAIPAFVSAAANEGWRLQTGVPERAGWPWAPTVRLHGVTITRTATPTSLLWTAEQIDLATPFHDLAALRVLPTGRQILQIPPNPPIELQAADAGLRIPFAAGDPAAFSISRLVVTAPTTAIRVESFRGEGRAAPSEATVFGVAASGIQFVPPLPLPFAGPMTASVQIAVNATACSPQINPAVDAGSSVKLPASEIDWGPLHMTATGTGGPDAECHLSGRATLHVKGAVDLVDALAHGGLIAAGQASAARAVLSLLAIAARGEPISLPVALADRTLTVARLPLLRLPPIDWPRASNP